MAPSHKASKVGCRYHSGARREVVTRQEGCGSLKGWLIGAMIPTPQQSRHSGVRGTHTLTASISDVPPMLSFG